MVSTLIKRASLDDAYDAAVAAAVGLRAQLRTYVTAARAAVSSGQAISSVSSTNGAGGRSVSFNTPDIQLLEGMTPVAIVEMWQSLVDLFDFSYSALGGTPNDLAVKNEMMALLVPVREVAPSSFLGLRCA